MKSFPKDNPMFEPFLSKAQREALDEMSMDLQEERGLMSKPVLKLHETNLSKLVIKRCKKVDLMEEYFMEKESSFNL